MTRAAACLLAALLAGFSPLEADEPNVARGNERLEARDPAGALSSYDAAERAVGSRPEIDHDRGNAALAAGRADEAKAAWRRAAERAPPALASRALQNLGTALAAEGDRDGAARAFVDALTKDPGNEDARWNLEVLLRKAGGSAPPAPSGASAPEAREAPRPGERSGPREGERDEPRRADAGGPRSPARPEPREGDEPGERRGEDDRAAGGREARPDRTEPQDAASGRAPPSRQEAEALLDALRARERHAPFPVRERRGGRRPDAAKDW